MLLVSEVVEKVNYMAKELGLDGMEVAPYGYAEDNKLILKFKDKGEVICELRF